MKESPIKIYDARWETGDFTHQDIENLFLSSCIYAKKLRINTVVISRDARVGCPEVVEIAVNTARKSGLAVFLCQDPISTPQSYYNTLRITENEPGTMGWTITASHNPSSYIGVKFVVSPVSAIGIESGPLGGLSEILRIYNRGYKENTSVYKTEGKLSLIQYSDDFIRDSMEWAGVAAGGLQGIKVVLDTLNGSAGTEVYRTLERTGVEITSLNLIVNGNFPFGAPNPVSEGKMKMAVKIAGEQTGTIVIGLDGDGDRIVFGDQDGLFSAGVSMVAVLTRLKSLDRTSLGMVLCDPKVDPPSLDFWSRLGYMPILFRNGHSQIKEYMRDQNIAVAAEESGHYYHRITRGQVTAYCENSLLTILLFLKAVQEEPSLLLKMRAIDRSVKKTGEMNYQFRTDKVRDQAISTAVSLLSEDNVFITRTTPEGLDLQGIAFSKGIHPQTRQIQGPDWYSGFYRISTNEKSVARFYITSGSKDKLKYLSNQISMICEKDLCGIKVE